MTAHIHTIEMKRGDMLRLNPVHIETAQGEPMNLNGYEVRWQLYFPNGNTPFLVKRSTNHKDVEVVNEEAGTLKITLASEDTADLPHGRYYHEIQVVDSNNQVTTVASGALVLLYKV